jgi:lipopolysaccharide/colanic/teichoic acid biosynthesis glycosyltransferase
VLQAAFHRGAALLLLIVLAPLLAAVALAVFLESPGGPFYRCERIGLNGRRFAMLKFRKMRLSATGSPLTAADDERLTRLGGFLAKSKLDELPQLWNVLCGRMNLVGPRPEDPRFVSLCPEAYGLVTRVRPGITGLSQLAFKREAEILDAADPIGDYLGRLLPQKLALDRLYVEQQSLRTDVRILVWTAAAVAGREIAVHRQTGRMGQRRRPSSQAVATTVLKPIGETAAEAFE